MILTAVRFFSKHIMPPFATAVVRARLPWTAAGRHDIGPTPAKPDAGPGRDN